MHKLILQANKHDECLSAACRDQHDTISTGMQIVEVTKPPSPQQQRVNQLRSQLDAARRAAKLVRLNQQQQRINQQRIKLSQTPK
jgi:hypothetical protein